MRDRNRLQVLFKCSKFMSDITWNLTAFKESLMLWECSLTSFSIIVTWMEIWWVKRPGFVGGVFVQIISHPFLHLQDFWVCWKYFWIYFSDFPWFFRKKKSDLSSRRISIEYLHWLTKVFINPLLNIMNKFGCSHRFGKRRIFFFFYIFIQTLHYRVNFLTLYVSCGQRISQLWENVQYLNTHDKAFIPQWKHLFHFICWYRVCHDKFLKNKSRKS